MNKALKILLIRPPFSDSLPQLAGNYWGCVPEPLGLAYIASYLINKFPGINIKILDAGIKNLSLEQVMAEVRALDWDMVGISYLTPQAKTAYSITRAIKSCNPGIKVIHGGVHATLFSGSVLENGADFCVLGEGEETFAELIESLAENTACDSIKGISYRRNGQVINNERRAFISNLDELPLPARHLLDLDDYVRHTIHVEEGLSLSIMASRGCPFSCNYCVSPLFWQRKVRFRTAENVLAEIKEAINKFGIRLFHFYDDNLTLNPGFVEKFCELIIREHLDIKWVFLDRTSHICQKIQLVDLMKKAGCVGIELGVEDCSQEVMTGINKQQTMDELFKVMEYINARQVRPLEEIMSFNPGETISSHYRRWENFSKFYCRKGLFIGQFATPYPRTEFDDRASEWGIKLVDNWEDRVTRRINFVPKSLLEDRPLKVFSDLPADINLQILKFILVRYSNLPKYKTSLLYSLLLRFIYMHCDGKIDVLEISKLLSKDFEINRNMSLRLVAYSMIIFAQIGIVKSYGNEDRSSLHDVFPSIGLRGKIYSYILNKSVKAIGTMFRPKKLSSGIEDILTIMLGRDADTALEKVK
jgi:magnesium-protoporphyrin IX monomethyl ester (oxidative) cyclase